MDRARAQYIGLTERDVTNSNAVVSQYDIAPMVQIYATTQGRDRQQSRIPFQLKRAPHNLKCCGDRQPRN